MISILSLDGTVLSMSWNYVTPVTKTTPVHHSPLVQLQPFLSVFSAHPLAPPFFLLFSFFSYLPPFGSHGLALYSLRPKLTSFSFSFSSLVTCPFLASLFSIMSLFCPFLSLSPSSFSPSHSYESTQEILPGSPRLTSFPTVSGSPASLASSMDAVSKATRSSPCRRRLQSTVLM